MTARLVESDDDIRAYVRNMRTSFFAAVEPVPDDAIAFLRGWWAPDRTWMAEDDDGQPCGTSRTFVTELTVPGGATVPMAAVTQVTVLPTHRRQGHLTAMMAAMLDDACSRGEPFAGLIASEWPIYGRYGYGPATEWATLRIDATEARFRAAAPSGTVALVSREELRDLAPAVFDAHRLMTPGAISRTPSWWDVVTLGITPRPGEQPSVREQRVVHVDHAGTVDGYAIYEPKERWENGLSQTSIEVRELIASNASAHRELWRFLVDIDLVVRVDAWPRPVDEPLPHHLVNARAVRWRERSDQLWLNVLDVPRVLEARRYRGADSVVLEVDGARWQLDGASDGASCTSTSASADLVLPRSTLGAVYLGGTPWHALASAGLVDEERPGALDRAAALFSTPRAPFLTSHF